MAQRVYAKPSEYAKFIGSDDFDDDAIKALLRRASAQVEAHVRTAHYLTDDDGYPTDAVVSDALRDATCAYAAYWDETGDPTGADAVAGPTRILSVSLGGTATGGASSRTAADARRSEEALTILRNAGLIGAGILHS
jgi:hypothetical protein